MNAATAFIQAASRYRGQDYVWGGGHQGKPGVDCSGLVIRAMKEAGLDPAGAFEGTASTQSGKGTPVEFSELKPGDLVFTRHGGKVDHVGIYLGEGRVLHAPKPGMPVGEIKLDYFIKHGGFARRVFDAAGEAPPAMPRDTASLAATTRPSQLSLAPAASEMPVALWALMDADLATYSFPIDDREEEERKARKAEEEARMPEWRQGP